jgi:hypothetical protein
MNVLVNSLCVTPGNMTVARLTVYGCYCATFFFAARLALVAAAILSVFADGFFAFLSPFFSAVFLSA